MQIKFAHRRERSTNGGWIDFAVFEATATSGGDAAKDEVLADLTFKARRAGHKIDQSALAYNENGRLRFFGHPKLVDFLAKSGLPQHTHILNV